MRTSDTYIEIQGTINTTAETAKAISVKIQVIDGTPAHPAFTTWFPKSQIREIKYAAKESKDLDSFEASYWICEQKRLFDEID